MSTITATGPVTSDERIGYLDILRGFAVMAIFVVNIKAMTMPFPYYMNPSAWASETDRAIAIAQKFLIDDKWRTIFTALYGAGLAMIAERLAERGQGLRILWARNAWLLVFGLIHLLLIWQGDILTFYALAGFLAVLFVRMGTVKLYVSGAILLALGWLWMSFFSLGPVFDEDLAGKLGGLFWEPTSETAAAEVAAYRGGIDEHIAQRASGAVGYVIFYFLMGGQWLGTLGLMVMGMALFRSGFLTGRTPAWAAALLAVAGLGASWGMEAWQVERIAASGYAYEVYSLTVPLSILDGWAGALGYAALVSLFVGWGLKFGAVAALGRMAFTNYIACSLIGTTLGGGHAVGWFGEVGLTTLMIVVALGWIAMLIWSSLWLKTFRFGPLEWLWRSLTYGKVQPFRR